MNDTLKSLMYHSKGFKVILIDGSQFSGKTYYCKHLASILDYDYQTGLVDRKNIDHGLKWIPMWYGCLFVLDYIRQMNQDRMRGVVIDRSSLTSVIFNNPIDPKKCLDTFKSLLDNAKARLIILNPSHSVLKHNIKLRSPELYSPDFLTKIIEENEKYMNLIKEFDIPCWIENLN